MPAQETKIIEKTFKKDRWYVTLSDSLNGRKSMPHANYIWLKGNPAFEDIPKGYLVHHLDHDEQNDDISNLALMQKYHHTAHHWKQKIIKPKIDIRFNWKTASWNRLIFFPTREPTIHQRKRRKTWIVCFRENINGVIRSIKIGRHNGQMFTTHKMAEDFKKIIWDDAKTT